MLWHILDFFSCKSDALIPNPRIFLFSDHSTTSYATKSQFYFCFRINSFNSVASAKQFFTLKSFKNQIQIEEMLGFQIRCFFKFFSSI